MFLSFSTEALRGKSEKKNLMSHFISLFQIVLVLKLLKGFDRII